MLLDGILDCGRIAIIKFIFMSKKNFAVVYTVKNESRLLPSAIEYYLAAGCSKIYIFFDGTTDNTRDMVRDYDGVRLNESIRPNNLADLPSWITQIVPWWETDMDVRKRINTYFATKSAFSDGIEWVLCVDPDEIMVPNINTKININLIPDFLEKIPEDVDQILVRNLELIPTTAELNNPFKSSAIFLNRFPMTELFWRYSSALMRRLLGSPRLHAWYDYLFYRLRFFNALPRLMVHPVSKEKIPASYFLGYSNHKSFVRSSFYGDYNFVVHKWVKYKSSPKNIFCGFLLHYDLFDYKYMVSKFGQRSESMLLVVFYFRYMLASVARETSLDQAKEFFLKYIAITDRKRIDVLLRKKIVVEVKIISEFFDSIGKKKY